MGITWALLTFFVVSIAGARIDQGRTEGGIGGYLDNFGYRLEDYEWMEVVNLTDKDGCVAACDAEKKCLSFDWSPDDSICWVNKESSVTQKEGLRKRTGWGNYLNKDRADDHCPEGAMIQDDTYRCYTISEEQASWYDASTSCSTQGGRMASIPDSATQRTFRRQGGDKLPNAYWLGLNDITEPGVFYWKWGNREVQLRDYYPWAEGEPTEDDTKNCVYINSNSEEWFTDDCTVERFYACEFRPRNDRDVYPLCPIDWMDFDRQCYSLYRPDAGYSYDEAVKTCDNKNSDMSSLTNADQIDYVLDYLNEKYKNQETSLAIWLGLTRSDTNDDLVWPDGTVYTDNIPGTLTIDSSQTVNCVALSWTGDWFTWEYRDCSEKNAVVCQGDPWKMTPKAE